MEYVGNVAFRVPVLVYELICPIEIKPNIDLLLVEFEVWVCKKMLVAQRTPRKEKPHSRDLKTPTQRHG